MLAEGPPRCFDAHALSWLFGQKSRAERPGQAEELFGIHGRSFAQNRAQDDSRKTVNQ